MVHGGVVACGVAVGAVKWSGGRVSGVGLAQLENVGQVNTVPSQSVCLA